MSKPHFCSGCVLETKSTGYAAAVGPISADLFFLGESLGRDEAFKGLPFSGASGGLLNRAISLANRNLAGQNLGLHKEITRQDNSVRCFPPNAFLDNAPWEREALAQCKRSYLEPSIESWLAAGNPARKVMVTLGAVPLRNILNLEKKGVKVPDFHGTANRDPSNRFWVVPTYHPTFVQRGAFNLLGVLSYDIQVAVELAAQGHSQDPAECILDPPLDWFTTWVDQYLHALRDDQEGLWLSVDIETPEKGKKGDEGELNHKDRDYQILRINFACHPDEGITVPYIGGYISQINRLLESPATKIFWNAAYDVPRLKQNGHTINPKIMDFMWGWHHLQSDLPRGLGFVAPFYSKYGPWKHLSSSNPVLYAAIDSFQTLRCAYGIAADLKAKGLWESFWSHVYLLDTYCLEPAEEVGLLVDQNELGILKQKLDAHHERLDAEIQKIVPDELLPLNAGWKTPPPPDKVPLSSLVMKMEKHLVKFCLGCNLVVKSAKHKKLDDGSPCPNPLVELRELEVPRYYIREPFNPGSSQQLLQYMAHFKHKPKVDKRSRRPSSGKDSLEHLKKLYGDKKLNPHPLYGLALQIKSVDKVRSTYVNGTITRLEDDPRSRTDGRLHPSTGHKPSTQRLSQQNPNLQNVIADRGGAENLAAGFRKCLVAASKCRLIEADFSGIEAVQTGWFCRDPHYIRLAKLGVHAYVSSHLAFQRGLISEAASISWSDSDLLSFFADIKKRFPELYDQSKRTVHGCLTGEHEVLTPKGWQRLDELQAGTSVMQWDSGELSFVVPEKLTNIPLNGPKEMINLNGRGIQVQMTLDHRVPVNTRKGFQVEEVVARNLVHGSVPVTGNYPGEDIENSFLPNWAIQLAVAIQADACIPKDSSQQHPQAIFHLVKARKVKRLQKLCREGQIDYRQVACSDHPNGVRIVFTIPEVVFAVFNKWRASEKLFKFQALLQLPKEQRKLFLAETLLWDGSIRKNLKRVVYLTTNKANAEVVQTIAHTVGMQALLRLKPPINRGNRKPLYIVSFNQRKWARLENLKKTTVPMPKDTRVYCVTVPSSYFLVRYKETISVTGNTNYGQSERGLQKTYPKLFKDVRAAQEVRELYFAIAPKVKSFQAEVRERAARQGYLGGNDHPYRYIHWFFNVLNYQKVKGVVRSALPVVSRGGTNYTVGYGEDSKRCLPLTTKVWMGDFSFKQLGDIVPGDVVIGWKRGEAAALPSRGNEDTQYMKKTKRFRTDHLVRTSVNETHKLIDETLTLVFASGRRIRCTKDHQWLAYRRHTYEYKEAQALVVGDNLCRLDVEDPGDCPQALAQWADRMILNRRFRRLDMLVAILPGKLEEVACITTGTGNFFADGFCSHNCVAFYPQSTAAGNIKDALLGLFLPRSSNFIGDLFYGKTPFRAPIHDSILLEVPDEHYDRVLNAVTIEMMRPITCQPLDPTWNLGKFLSIGIEVKSGHNWGSFDAQYNPQGMQKVKLPEIDFAFSSDVPVPIDEYDVELSEEDQEMVEKFKKETEASEEE